VSRIGDAGTHVLGIDVGGTVVKAVLFDLDGVPVAAGHARSASRHPQPGWAERDADDVWSACATAVRACLDQAADTLPEWPGPAAIAGVGLVGHGDGAYLVDRHGVPVLAIAATDGRAVGEARALATDRVLAMSGTHPFPGSPPALAAWLAVHEPGVLDRSAAWLMSKDWLRFRLTGEICTDETDASGAFTDVSTGEYSDELIETAGFTAWRRLLPPIRHSADVVGGVTADAAAATGLAVGTPVVCGAHDCDGAAIGMGAIEPGHLSLIAGTFSINQVVTPVLATDPRWQARRFVRPGESLAMATSPASASNLDWFLREFGPGGPDALGTVNADVAGLAGPTGPAGIDASTSPVFLPFIYGAPHGFRGGGGFVGVRAGHTRAHLLRAVFEGVVCNHRAHVEALRDGFTLTGAVRLTGGGARSAVWTQMFADALAMTVEIPTADEAGALGAAVLAGWGVGVWPSLTDAVVATTSVRARFEPTAAGMERFETLYRRYRRVVEALSAIS
jgi:L-xylulokinase